MIPVMFQLTSIHTLNIEFNYGTLQWSKLYLYNYISTFVREFLYTEKKNAITYFTDRTSEFKLNWPKEAGLV